MVERWEEVPGWPYEVSHLGRVRNKYTQNVLKGSLTGGGYRQVVLCREGERWYVDVHRLICTVYRRPPEEGEDARHLDGDKTNNRASNLAWGSRRDNMEDAARHGTIPRGEERAGAKMNEDRVRELRQRRDAGEPITALAKEFGIAKGIASQIANRKRWRHVV